MFYLVPAGIASYLIFSAAAKVFQLRDLERAMRQILRHERIARAVAWLAPPVEWVVAMLLLVWPSSLVARASLVVLFAAFAAFAVIALATRTTVDCGCLGNFHHGRLGWPQLCQFLIIVLAALLAFPGRDLPARQALLIASGVQALVCLVFAITFAYSWSSVRRQRLSLAAASGLVARKD